MKNYILFLIIGLLVVNTSCDSWLEETQFDKINSSTLYESEEGIGNRSEWTIWPLSRLFPF